MRDLVLAVSLAMLAPAAAQAQAPAPEAPAAPAPFDGDTPIEAIAADTAGKAALEKTMPNLLAHPHYEQFKNMSLRQLQPLSGGAITDEEITAVEAELKAAAAN